MGTVDPTEDSSISFDVRSINSVGAARFNEPEVRIPLLFSCDGCCEEARVFASLRPAEAEDVTVSATASRESPMLAALGNAGPEAMTE